MFRKGSIVFVVICMVAPCSFAQKSFTQIGKAVLTKDALRVPLKHVRRLPSSQLLFQQSLLRGIEEASQRKTLEQVLFRHPTLHIRPFPQIGRRDFWFPPANSAEVLSNKGADVLSVVKERVREVEDYFKKHPGKWPSALDGTEGWYILENVRKIMSMYHPFEECSTAQQELIRLRAAQGDVEKIVPAVQVFLAEYGTLPVYDGLDRVYFNFNGEDPKHFRLWEDFSFAMMAAQIPMEQNPFASLEGLPELIERYQVLSKLRRASNDKPGISVFYDGKAQIPAWTMAEYKEKQAKWAQTYPMVDYALLHYRYHFYEVPEEHFECLPKWAQTVVLFTTPGLPELDPQRLLPPRNKNRAQELKDLRGGPVFLRDITLYEQILLGKRTVPSSELRFFGKNSLWLTLGEYPFLEFSLVEQKRGLEWIWHEYGVPPWEALPRLTGIKF